MYWIYSIVGARLCEVRRHVCAIPSHSERVILGPRAVSGAAGVGGHSKGGICPEDACVDGPFAGVVKLAKRAFIVEYRRGQDISILRLLCVWLIDGVVVNQILDEWIEGEREDNGNSANSCEMPGACEPTAHHMTSQHLLSLESPQQLCAPCETPRGVVEFLQIIETALRLCKPHPFQLPEPFLLLYVSDAGARVGHRNLPLLESGWQSFRRCLSRRLLS
jgi:hypothetical protein